MGNEFFFEWERSLILLLQGGEGLIPLFSKVFGFIGSELFLVPLLLFIYLGVDKELALGAAVNTGVVLVLNPAVKNVTCRRRPYFDLEGVKCLVPVEKGADIFDIAAQGWSFPSGHSSNSAAVLGTLAKDSRAKAARTAYYAVIFLVGISRVAAGNHFPTDVIAGWALGVFSIMLMQKLPVLFRSRERMYAAIFAVSLTGCLWCRTADYYSGLGVMAGVFAGDLYERKFVRFKTTDVLKWRILRFAGAAAVFIAISQGIKLFVSADFLSASGFFPYLVRVLRYGTAVFVSMGVYPAVFKAVEGRNGSNGEKQ